MLSLILELHNFVTAPLADYFFHRKSCEPYIIFGNHFQDYYFLWFLALLIVWSVVYYAFKTIVRSLLRRMGLTVSRARRTAAALWCAGTGLGAALLSSSQLESSPWSLEIQFDSEAMPPPPHVGMYLTVLATCLAHRLIAGCIRRGVTRQTLADVLQIAFLPATFIARWPGLGFSVSLFISLAQIILELARLCWSFKKGLYLATFGFVMAYTISWSAVYLLVLPAWLVSVATTPVESREHHRGLALIFLTLTLHILVSCTFSPLVLSLKGCFYGAPAGEWLEAALFPGTDQAILKMKKQAKVKRDSMEALALARRNSTTLSPKKKLPTPTEPNKKSNDAKALIQTVRCVTLLKRKIRAMREKKAQMAEMCPNNDEN